MLLSTTDSGASKSAIANAILNGKSSVTFSLKIHSKQQIYFSQ